MDYQLTLKLSSKPSNYEIFDISTLEEKIESIIYPESYVDGHDIGIGEINIFIHTNKPQITFEKIKNNLGTEDFTPDLTAGYRKFGEEIYTPLFPKDVTHFEVK